MNRRGGRYPGCCTRVGRRKFRSLDGFFRPQPTRLRVVGALHWRALETRVKPSVLYRVASGLLLLFAAGHTFGFSQADPEWGVGAVIGAMQSSQFTVQGFTRTYWDFFLGAGFTVGVLYLFAAVLAWQLSGLPKGTLASLRFTTWGFAACFVAVAVLSFLYLFWIPIVMSGVIAVCLTAAAAASGSRREKKESSGAGAA